MNESSWFEQQYRPWRVADSGIQVDALVAGWASSSAQFLGRAQMMRNLCYGTVADERLDLFVPTGVAAPVLVFLHGGYWQSLDKDDYAFALEPLVSAGALVASINYSLCPKVGLDKLIEQVRTACAWVWRNVELHGGNPQRIVVAGHSAGGHLAAMMAATDWPALAHDLPRDLVKGMVTVSGVFDLEPLLPSSINDALRLDRESAKRFSPLHLAPSHSIPVSVVVGANETAEFRRQAADFARKWRPHSGSMEYIETEGHNHFQVMEAMLEPSSVLTATILRQLQDALPTGAEADLAARR